jgi:hypothetical protein
MFLATGFSSLASGILAPVFVFATSRFKSLSAFPVIKEKRKLPAAS